MIEKTNAKQQRINALEQLVALLRKQSNGMRRSLAEKDVLIERYQWQLKCANGYQNRIGWFDNEARWHDDLMPLDAADNSEPIHR